MARRNSGYYPGTAPAAKASELAAIRADACKIMLRGVRHHDLLDPDVDVPLARRLDPV